MRGWAHFFGDVVDRCDFRAPGFSGSTKVGFAGPDDVLSLQMAESSLLNFAKIPMLTAQVKISVFMNVFNVHSNRTPLAGVLNKSIISVVVFSMLRLIRLR
jgi:hypothetical protein